MNSYVLRFGNVFWPHGRDRSRYLRDAEPGDRRQTLYTQVKSGDLFITLATQLDGLSQQLDGSEITEQLQNLVTDLLLLQSGYEIIQKDITA